MEDINLKKFFKRMFWKDEYDMIKWFRANPQYKYHEQDLKNGNIVVMIEYGTSCECFWLKTKKKLFYKYPVIILD